MPSLSRYNVDEAVKFVLSKLDANRHSDFLWLLYVKLFLALGVDLHEKTVCSVFDGCLENVARQDAFLFYFLLVLAASNGSEEKIEGYWRRLLCCEQADSSFLFGCCVVLRALHPAVLQRTDRDALFARLHPSHQRYIGELMETGVLLPLSLTTHCPVEAACRVLMDRWMEGREEREREGDVKREVEGDVKREVEGDVKREVEGREKTDLEGDVTMLLNQYPFLSKKNDDVECVCGSANKSHAGWCAVLLFIQSSTHSQPIDPLFLFFDSYGRKLEKGQFVDTAFSIFQTVPLLHAFMHPSTVSSVLRRVSPSPLSPLLIEPETVCLCHMLEEYSVQLEDWTAAREEQMKEVSRVLRRRLKYAFENPLNRGSSWQLCVMCLLYLGVELYLNGYERFVWELNRVMRGVSGDSILWTFYVVLIMNMPVFRLNRAYLTDLTELLKDKTLYLKEQSIESPVWNKHATLSLVERSVLSRTPQTRCP